ncbi:hypothetical protein [Streptomyces sp. NPDC014685]|uniref:hypothetical protein n=1 Tax=Streptomyces sp. NPDC014685 TaxID=3364881 RepID=UPI0037019E8F
MTTFHDLPARGGSSGGGGAGGNELSGSAVDVFDNFNGWKKSHDRSGLLERGGDTGSQIRDQLRHPDVKSDDLEWTLNNLANYQAGCEIAEIIASGKFRGLER